MLKGTGADLVSDLATAAYRAVWAGLDYRERPRRVGKLMLLSGGLDSAAVASIERPDRALFVNYGQVPAEAERNAARAIAQHLDLELDEVDVDLSTLGSGLLAGHPQVVGAPTPEWFPFRNQHLVTIAAAQALKHDLGAVVLGLVKGDGERHKDGTPEFASMVDTLVRHQEGEVRVLAPYIDARPHELLARSGLGEDAMHQTHSCYRSGTACGQCPGCTRRTEVLQRLTRHREDQAETSDS